MKTLRERVKTHPNIVIPKDFSQSSVINPIKSFEESFKETLEKNFANNKNRISEYCVPKTNIENLFLFGENEVKSIGDEIHQIIDDEFKIPQFSSECILKSIDLGDLDHITDNLKIENMKYSQSKLDSISCFSQNLENLQSFYQKNLNLAYKRVSDYYNELKEKVSKYDEEQRIIDRMQNKMKGKENILSKELSRINNEIEFVETALDHLGDPNNEGEEESAINEIYDYVNQISEFCHSNEANLYERVNNMINTYKEQLKKDIK